jgi:ABC-type phosphate transport system substrate-binding protein
MRSARFLPAVGLAVWSAAALAGTDARSYVVVVNESNPRTTLPAAEVARAFQRTVRHWDNGVAIEPVDQSFQSAVRLSFSQEILGRSPGQMQEYWLRSTYSGRDVPPPVRPSDSAVLDFVRATPGGIGYVSASASLPSGVKALAVSSQPGRNP